MTCCEDCARKGLAPSEGPQCYAVCSYCGIKRACFGDDPGADRAAATTYFPKNPLIPIQPSAATPVMSVMMMALTV